MENAWRGVLRSVLKSPCSWRNSDALLHMAFLADIASHLNHLKMRVHEMSPALLETFGTKQLKCANNSQTLSSKAPGEGGLFLETRVPLSTPQGLCVLNGRQHVWQHSHLREQRLYNEARQVKAENQADTVPSHASRVYTCCITSVCCAAAAAGEATRMSLGCTAY